jgi:hypothetical protein
MREAVSASRVEMASPESPSASPLVIQGLDELRRVQGTDLGPTAWLQLESTRIETFRQSVTGAPRPEFRESHEPTPEAPPFLLLALSNLFLPQLIEVQGIAMGVNYGVDHVVFPAPAEIDRRLRGRGQVTACDEIAGGIQVTIRVTVEVEGRERPACVVDTISRWLA